MFKLCWFLYCFVATGLPVPFRITSWTLGWSNNCSIVRKATLRHVDEYSKSVRLTYKLIILKQSITNMCTFSERLSDCHRTNPDEYGYNCFKISTKNIWLQIDNAQPNHEHISIKYCHNENFARYFACFSWIAPRSMPQSPLAISPLWSR